MSLSAESLPLLSFEHDCPYETYAERMRSRLGARGVSSALWVSQLEKTLTSLHGNNNCPPTHRNTQPTPEWDDFINTVTV